MERIREQHGSSVYKPPSGMALALKQDFRQRAMAEGSRPEPYTHEEVLRLYAEDVATVEGRGWVAECAGAEGWQTVEAKEILEGWIEHARQNLKRLEELSEDRWHDVYDAEDAEAALELIRGDEDTADTL